MSRPNSPYNISGNELPDEDDDWRLSAACRGLDTSLWFPSEAGDSASNRLAKRICKTCPVQPQCLQFALDNNEPWGVWGGMSARQRLDFQRRRLRPRSMDSHGTESDYNLHLRLGTVPCAECRRAHAKYVAAKRERMKRKQEPPAPRRLWDIFAEADREQGL